MGSKNTTTNNYKVVVASGGKRILKYDLNGNLTEISIPNSQFLIQYGWDAANRLVEIQEHTAQGLKLTAFTYDGLGRRVAEKLNGVVIKRWLWCRTELCEERDAGGAVIKRFYPWGMVIVVGPNAGSYFYTWDHLGSIREVTDNTGIVKARYDYDSYGRRTLVSGTDLADFGYTGYYYHKPSGLNLALYRAYDAEHGRFISRDPIEEDGGLNLYGYVSNNPLNWIDSLGLDATSWGGDGRSVFDGPKNGNWGGKNWGGGWNPQKHGGNEGLNGPTDSADECYKAHDLCYDRCAKKCPKAKKVCIAVCNQALVNCLKKLPDDPKKWPHPPKSGTEGDSSKFRKDAIWYFN